MSLSSLESAVKTRPLASPRDWQIERRDFLKVSAASLFGLMSGACQVSAPAARPRAPMRFGLITDPHYADAPPRGKRFYRESMGKVQEAVERLRGEKVAFLAMLGDLKDMNDGEPDTRTLAHLTAIETALQKFGGPTYHVLGNHELDNLSKAQVTAHVVNTGIAPGRTYYAFSREGVRFVVLDANYDRDGLDHDRGKFDWKDTNIPPPQLEWLARELAGAGEPVIVFVHQRLDGDRPTSVRNRAAVRQQLEASGKVLAVFQGHDHPGDYTLINGIHYYTLRAVVEGSGPENNAYAVVDVAPNLDLTVTGYRLAKSMSCPHRPATTAAI